MSGSGQKTLPNIRNALSDVLECSGDHPGSAGVVSRPFLMSVKPSRMSGSGLEALLDVWEWSGGTPGCPGVVGRPSWMSGSGLEALPDVREWSGGPP